jgi:adenylate cyclase
MTAPDSEEARPKLTLWQRLAIRKLRRAARREDGEPLAPEDWLVAWRLHEQGLGRMVATLLRSLPSSPRCAVCGAPFAGLGAHLVAPLGYRPSRKNPTVCATCVEYSPPGGIVQYTGVLFADLRGFTERFAGVDPNEVPIVLRRFYRCAEDVLFPDAVIDKLIGDEVMALYLPELKPGMSREEVPARMVEHARALLERVGYGTASGPFVEVGIGLDAGEAFVGNIGQRALYDFTAVGDVVNTASRLQAHARGGEVVLSQRVAAALPAPPGTRVELDLKGKPELEVAYRLSA